MKKFIWFLSFIALVGLSNCGSGDKEAAKELLKRILQLVGIPQNIVVNICQDANVDGLCNLKETQTKITLKKGETAKSLLEKVALNENNQFFLENYDPTQNILLELQNNKSFRYDDGKFTFHYSPETQELSILQAMVDSGYLTAQNVADIKEANAVDEFYFVLLRDTYSNMNRLRAKGVQNKEAVAQSLKEMADELLLVGLDDNLTERLNACGDDKACIDKVLAEVSSGMLIEEDEARDIANLKKKPFVSKWNTDNNGVSAKNQITVPTTGSGYDYDIVWGDGTNNRNVTGDATHTYTKEGNYSVEIYGTFPQISFGKGDIPQNLLGKADNTDKEKIVSILNWGDIEWKSMDNAFFGCSNLKGEADDAPNLSKVTSLESMFNSAVLFDQNISDWNVSTIVNMKEMFAGAKVFNQNLGNWNISNVTDMTAMFRGLTLSVANYNALLIDWSQKRPKKGVTLDVGNSQYSVDAEAQRRTLTNTYGWTILDGGCDGSCQQRVVSPYNNGY